MHGVNLFSLLFLTRAWIINKQNNEKRNGFHNFMQSTSHIFDFIMYVVHSHKKWEKRPGGGDKKNLFRKKLAKIW
jgi:hypothetical protein